MSTAVDSERTSLELVEDELSQVVIGGATLGNTRFAGACARIGALVQLAGLVEPLRTLALLAEEQRIPGKKPKVNYMTTYASYLGELVECGLQHGYGPVDFGLVRIAVGGEIVSEALKERARQLFGSVEVNDDQGRSRWINKVPPQDGYGPAKDSLSLWLRFLSRLQAKADGHPVRL